MSRIGDVVRARFPEGSFGRNVAVLAGGTAAGQVLAALASPILTRMYTTEEFGTLAVYVSVLAILVVISSLSYELAIPMPDDDGVGANLLGVALLTVFGMVGLTTILALTVGDAAAGLIESEGLARFLWVLPVGVFGAGIFQALSYWAIRAGAFADIARARLLQGGGMVATQIGAGLAGAGTLGLLAGDVVGRSAGGTRLALLAWREHIEAIRQVTWQGMRAAASRYRRFPIFQSWGVLLNTIGTQIPPVLFAAFYGLDEAGLFGLSYRIVGIPLTLIGGAVAQVYLREAAIEARTPSGRLPSLFSATARKLLLVGLGPALILVAAGPAVFGFVFGDAWTEAGTYARIMGVMLLAQFVVAPLSQTLNVLERQDWQLAWDASRLVLVLGALVWASETGRSPATAVAAFSAAMLLAYVALFFVSRRAIARGPRHA